jgi:hypothetical protein
MMLVYARLFRTRCQPLQDFPLCVSAGLLFAFLQDNPDCALSVSVAQLHPNGCGTTDPMVRHAGSAA